MYRKRRLTAKLRKKQKIVVSAPRNLWYDTCNIIQRKGKTADMEKNEISGAAIAPLFQLSRDAVCGAAQGYIVFANPAACRLFGADITGERVEKRFPGLEEDVWGDSFATTVTALPPRAAARSLCSRSGRRSRRSRPYRRRRCGRCARRRSISGWHWTA